MEPKDVVRRFLDHGMTDGQWNMDVIEECFADRYYSHTWKGDLAHTGEVFGLAPTGREVTVQHVEMWRVTDGKIVEHWGGLGEGSQLYRALTQPE